MENDWYGCVYFELGLPPYIPIEELPDVLVLGDTPGTTTFRLFTREMKVFDVPCTRRECWVETYDQNMLPNEEQVFYEANIDLKNIEVSAEDYDQLDDGIMDTIYGAIPDSAFSIQQLLLDLTNLFFTSVPQIPGVDPGGPVAQMLNAQFAGYYFDAFTSEGTPIINMEVNTENRPAGSLRLTKSQVGVSLVVDDNGLVLDPPTDHQAKASTLNYYCAIDDQPLNLPKQFSWNWIDPDLQTHPASGVLSVSRDTFATIIQEKLIGHARRLCIKPDVNITGTIIRTTYGYSLTKYNNPDISYPTTGDKVLSFSWSASDYASLEGPVGTKYKEFGLDFDYNMDVYLTGTQMRILQTYVVDAELRVGINDHDQGKVINRVYDDIYEISVDADGTLLSEKSSESSVEINDYDINVGTIWNQAEVVEDFVEEMVASDFVAPDTLSINPLDSMRGFIFPAGQIFTFTNSQFSNHQDLVAYITYANNFSRKRMISNHPAALAISRDVVKRNLAESRTLKL